MRRPSSQLLQDTLHRTIRIAAFLIKKDDPIRMVPVLCANRDKNYYAEGCAVIRYQDGGQYVLCIQNLDSHSGWCRG